ncbi:MAG: acyl-CoA dehydrogenase family protein [Actinomycetota bacterium]|nr:acyl-CoA dehydrogenase family protein [Actinomycetota bacterium]
MRTVPAVDLRLTADEEALVDLCRGFAHKEISTVAPRAWEEERCPVELLRRMGELGLLGLLVPQRWGGSGMSTVGFVAAMEEIGTADQSVAAAWQAHCTIGSLPLLEFGTDAQRERWLVPLADGRALGAFGLTEPGAGSDTRAIQTRAQRGDGGWVINGRKAFISNAGTDMSFGVTLLARTGTTEDGHPRFGSFVVETGTAGYTAGPKLRGIGWRGLDTRELYFDDVWVPDDQLIGNADLGLRQFLATLEVGRISVAALSLSLIRAVLALARDYAKARRQFGAPISSFQAIQFKLADIATEYEAARWLTYRAAALRDAKLPFRREAAMAKLKASRTAMWAATEALQVFGGVGYMIDSPVARFFCDAKVLEIGEGTNEIQRLVIARELGC